jgi:AcrR family transcriptional regulator
VSNRSTVSNTTADPSPAERRPSLREGQRAFTRSKFIEAAITVFETKGYAVATVDDIAQEAGASKATFYVYFKSKDEVARALFAEMEPEGRDAYAQLDEAIASGSRQQVRAWVRAAFEWWENNRGAVLALEQIVASGGFGHGGLDQVQAEAMPRYLSSWAAEDHDEARLRIYISGALVTRTYRAARIDGLFSDLDDDQLIDILTDLWISALQLPTRQADGNWAP